MAGTPKPLMICPFCDDTRSFAVNGMTAHIRAKHPEQLKNFQENRDKFIAKYAVDEFGNPKTAPTPSAEPEPPAEPLAAPEPEPEPPKKKTTPKPKPVPEVKPEEPPAEKGFLEEVGEYWGFTDD